MHKQWGVHPITTEDATATMSSLSKVCSNEPLATLVNWNDSSRGLSFIITSWAGWYYPEELRKGKSVEWLVK